MKPETQTAIWPPRERRWWSVVERRATASSAHLVRQSSDISAYIIAAHPTAGGLVTS